MHHTQRHIHSLSSHHCSNHIISTAFMTSHTLYTTSHTWQHKSYICHLTLYIWHYIHCSCVIKPSVSIVLHPLSVWCYTLYVWHHIQVCMTSHEHFMTSHQYRCDITSSVSMTSYPIYMISPLLFHENKRLYLASHPLYLTSQRLHLCGHTHSISAFTIIMVVSHLSHVWHNTHPTSRQIQTLWHQSSVFRHQKHCIHDIRSPIYDITSSIYYISSPIPVTSQPLYQ